MDDLRFEDALQVPEPGSLALVLAGLGIAGAVRAHRSMRQMGLSAREIPYT